MLLTRTCGAVAVFAGAVLPSTSSFAGGFDRFDQDVSLLFDPAPTVVDLLGTSVQTSSSYDSVDGKIEQVPIIQDFLAGSLRLKVTPRENFACLLHLGQPFGTDIDHGLNWSRADVVTTQQFRVNEYGLSCSYRFDLAGGYVRIIAGVTRDSIDFEQRALSPAPLDGVAISELSLEGDTTSWRGGVAYELPSVGLVASLVYYAPIEFDLEGRLSSPFVAASVIGHAEFPQAVEVNLRAFVAPAWLAGLSLKWSDWSALQHVSVLSRFDTGPISAGAELVDLKTFFRDGVTASILIGHAIDQNWSAWARVAWDRGVTTGWTEHTQSWSLFGGLKHRLNETIEVSANLGVIWLTQGAIATKEKGGPFDATFDDDIAIVPQAGLTLRF